MLFPKIAFFGIFEHVTSKKNDVRQKIDVRIDVNFFFNKFSFSKMFKMQNKHQKNAYPTKKIKCLMECLVCFGLRIFRKKTFLAIYWQFLRLIKSEDLSEQKMTKLLKGAYSIIF